MKPNLSATDLQQPLSLDVIKSLMDDIYYLVYVDYRDNLYESLDAIVKCMKEKSGDSLSELFDNHYGLSQCEEVGRITEELKQTCINIGYSPEQVGKVFTDNYDSIRDEIYNRDKSDYISEIVGNTRNIPVMVKLHSNYDCINSNWFESQGGYSYRDHYFGHMIDALNMNPLNVKEMLKSSGYNVCGRWPNKSSRNGKELVSEKDFMAELINSCCGANLLIFMATINLKELWKADFKINKVIIPKGNT